MLVEGGCKIQWLRPHKKRRHRDTHRKVGHEKVKTENGATQHWAKECQELLGATKSWKEEFFLRAFRVGIALPTPWI